MSFSHALWWRSSKYISSNLGVIYWKQLNSVIIITESCPGLGFALTSWLFCRLTQMWRTMHESHKAQALISQHLSNLSDNHNMILNSEYHHQATIQFETEASYWYNSFCKLVKFQREYVRTLYEWIKLAESLKDGNECSNHSSILAICDQWERGLNESPDKVLLIKIWCQSCFLGLCLFLTGIRQCLL